MHAVLQVITVFLASITFALSLSHALELPGKLRLDRATYCAVQEIYYPGFTFAGVAEILAVISALVLLVTVPTASTSFVLLLIGAAGLIATHGTYWLLTHPVNGFWLKEHDLGAFSSGFFSFDPLRRQGRRDDEEHDAWMALRNRWELSHVLRAGFSGVALLALIVTTAAR